MTGSRSWWGAGESHGLVWDGGIALLDASLSQEIANEVWAGLADDADLAVFFATLSQASGRGLLDLPGFAVAIRTKTGLGHLAARGDFSAEALAGEQVHSVRGLGVTTWLEARVEGPTGLRVAGPAAGQDPTGTERPIVAGVVPSSTIRFGDRAVGEAHSPAVVAEIPSEIHRAVPVKVLPPKLRPKESPLPTVAEESPELKSPELMPVEAAPDVELPDQSLPVPQDSAEEAEFAHLWGEHTVLEPIENAAVRGGEEAASSPVAEAAGARRSPEETWIEAAERHGDSQADLVDSRAAQPEDQPEAAPTGLGGEPDGGFVASVPKRPQNTPSPPPPPKAFETGQVEFVPGKLPTPFVPGGAATEPDDGLGDHDGYTVLGLEIQKPDVFGSDGSDPGEGELLAAVCNSGHANPPHRPTCRVCRAPLDGETQWVARPSLGQLITSTGDVLELTGPITVGRDPKASRFQGTEIPRMLALPHPHVSANHLEIQLEDWNILAVDLRSTNGTFLRRHGEPPVRLPETPQLIIADDVLDLGHGVHLSFRDIP